MALRLSLLTVINFRHKKNATPPCSIELAVMKFCTSDEKLHCTFFRTTRE